MVVLLFMVGFLIVALNALVRSAREHFLAGVCGGLVRGGALVMSIVGGVRFDLARMAGQHDLAHQALVLVIANMLGPIVSFGVLFLAYRRTLGIPAAEEELARRPLNAWLPVAVIDAVLVAVSLLAQVVGADI